MGRFMSGDKLLLQHDRASGAWKRVPARGSLDANIPLVALPTYLCDITLTSGVMLQLQLLGGTRVELLPPDAQNVAGLKVDYGRLFILPAEAGTQLRLQLGGRIGTITFVDAGTEAALEVKPIHKPGSNPEQVAPTIIADIYVRKGKITWNDPGIAQQVEVQPNARLMLQGRLTRGPAQVTELPEETVSYLDQRASKMIEQSFRADQSASLNLTEMVDHRQREVRWLACRCLAHVNQFTPMVGALNDEALKLDWRNYTQQLLEAVARGPESAAAVREAMEKAYDTDATELYRMLWGYTQQQLAAGQDTALVELLDHDTLAVRVLSFWNLKEITGWGLFYKPEYTDTRRKQSIQRWNERLMAGEIRYKSAPTGAAATPRVAPPKP